MLALIVRPGAIGPFCPAIHCHPNDGYLLDDEVLARRQLGNLLHAIGGLSLDLRADCTQLGLILRVARLLDRLQVVFHKTCHLRQINLIEIRASELFHLFLRLDCLGGRLTE